MKRHLTSGLALALIAGLALTGCTKSADSAPTAAASSIPAVDPSRVSPTDLPTPPVVKDPKGAIRDLTLGDCKTDAGQQMVSGSITSTASTPTATGFVRRTPYRAAIAGVRSRPVRASRCSSVAGSVTGAPHVVVRVWETVRVPGRRTSWSSIQ